jgi:uncharacterized protein YlxP (DUF503 family)
VVVGVIGWELQLFEAQSLKEKRRVVKSLKERLRKFNVSVAETGQQDMWQRAEITACVVATDRRTPSRCWTGRTGWWSRRPGTDHRQLSNLLLRRRPPDGGRRAYIGTWLDTGIQRVNEQLKREISQILLGEVKDPRVGAWSRDAGLSGTGPHAGPVFVQLSGEMRRSARPRWRG